MNLGGENCVVNLCAIIRIIHTKNAVSIENLGKCEKSCVQQWRCKVCCLLLLYVLKRSIMHETGFTKLFSSIVSSTIWQEDDKTRIVWITILALSNRYGEVGASVPGLAALANVSLDDCNAALQKLKSPDPYSRSKQYEGRRIEEVEGGFLILNYGFYRDKMRNRAEYYREWRARNKTATILTTPPPIAEAEAEADIR